MSTSPKNQDALLWTAPKTSPSQATPGEHLWTVVKGTHTRRAEVRMHPEGCELQIFSDGQFSYGKLHLSRSIAIEEAAGCLELLEGTGWREPGAQK